MKNIVKTFILACAMFGALFAVHAYAQTNLGQPADIACITKCAAQKAIADQKKNPSLNCPTLGQTFIACQATAPGGGTVSGQCIYGVGCKALSATGSNGKSMGVGDLSQLMGMLGQLMKGLGGGGGGGGGGSGSGSGSLGGTQGCAQYYAVSTPSSDPCAYYVPSGSGTINIDTGAGSNPNGSGGNIGNLLGGNGSTDTGNPISNLISDLLGGNNDNANTNTTNASSSIGNLGTPAGGVSSSTAQGATNLGSGANGEIRVLPNGATIVITNQNGSGNSVTAGFLGTQAVGGMQPTSIVATWCRTRPWASNFLSFIIPATFFDSLCSLKGYQVGETAQVGGPAEIGSSVHIQNPAQETNIGTTASTSATVPQSPPMQVDIWAVPPAVPLGGRTTVYWNSKNAASCVETSPDGSFSHTTLAGGGATVPLSGATTFTISCMAPDGTHATADVVVRLSL